MTPIKDFIPFSSFLLGEEPTIEDFILLIGTVVAFVAFILWCCFPIQPKENLVYQQFTCKSFQHTNSTSQSHSSSGCCGNKNCGSPMYGFKMDQLNSQISYHCCSGNGSSNNGTCCSN